MFTYYNANVNVQSQDFVEAIVVLHLICKIFPVAYEISTEIKLRVQ